MNKRSMRFVGPVLGLCVIFVVIVWQIGGCGVRLKPGRAEAERPVFKGPTVPVEAVALPVTYTAVGTIRSRTEVELAARMVGRILAVSVRSGDRVCAGDVLVTLDDAELKTVLSQAKERASSAQASIASAAEQIVQTRSALELAKVEVDRYRKLFEQKAVAQQALDTAEDAFRQASARAAQAEQGQVVAQADARAALEAQRQAETVLGYAVIASPMDGVVASRQADPGDLATPGQAILNVFDPSRLLLEAPVREGLVAKVKVGDRLPVAIEALGKTVETEVREVVPAIDPGSRTFLTKLCLPPLEGVMPGMFGTVSLKLGERPALVLPAEAVVRAGQLEYADVVADGKATRTLVRTVPIDGGRVEVLSGLRANDAVAIGIGL